MARTFVWARPYLVATACVLVALTVRLLLQPWLGTTQIWVTFWPATFLAAWWGGFRSGILATLLTILVISFWLVPPAFAFGLNDAAVISSVVFVVSGVVFAAVAESARRARADERAQREAADAARAEEQRQRELADRARAEERRQREAADAARAEALAANRAKDEFLAVLGHELRNPLSPMVVAIELLRMRGQASRELDVIERQLGHMTGLVNDLLDVSRIIRGQIELVPEVVELAALVEKAAEMISPPGTSKQHAVELDVPLGLTVRVDPSRLVQVLSNLLTNAVKFSPPGARIRVAGEREGDRVVVRVIDQGAGMDAELLARAFEPFVQGAQSSDRAAGGLGLGLAISRQLVELHGGTLTATSRGPGQGTELRAELPFSEAARASAATSEPSGAVKRPVASQPALRILVVDDNEDAAQLLSDVLVTRGHVVRVCFDGEAALETAATFDPALALLDIGLPGMDGHELARTLRARGSTAHLVALTGYCQEADRQRALASGFDEHLSKPVSLAKLDQTIARLTASAASPAADLRRSA